MRKYVFVFALLLTLAAATAFAWVGQRDYFSDAAMTQQTGAEWVNCDGSTNWQWGTTSTYRRFEGLNCGNAQDVIFCQRWDGSKWVYINCPY